MFGLNRFGGGSRANPLLVFVPDEQWAVLSAGQSSLQEEALDWLGDRHEELEVELNKLKGLLKPLVCKFVKVFMGLNLAGLVKAHHLKKGCLDYNYTAILTI